MTPNNPTKDDCKIFAAAKLYLETNDPAYLSLTVAKAVARKYGISEQTVFRVVVALHLQGDLRATIAEVYGDALDQPDAHDVGFWYGQVKDMHRGQGVDRIDLWHGRTLQTPGRSGWA